MPDFELPTDLVAEGQQAELHTQKLEVGDRANNVKSPCVPYYELDVYLTCISNCCVNVEM